MLNPAALTYTPPAGLRYDDQEHKYFIDSRPIISVTNTIREAGLSDYGFSDGSAMDRGTAIHTVTELFDKGALNVERIDNPLLPYFSGYLAFLEDHKPTFLAIEELVGHSTYGYAGRLDRRLILGDHETVLDIKTGQPAAWHGLQTAAYAKCIPRPCRRVSLLLSDNGSYKLNYHTNEDDWGVFRAALTIVMWKRNNGVRRKLVQSS